MIRETRTRLDRRGVSEVIGSILVFGLVVLLLTIVQTHAVPNANQDVEIQHSQEVQEDVARLSSAVSQAAIGQGSSVTVATGTSYPNRLVLFNPPAPSGNLRSTDGGTVGLTNVRAVDEEARDRISGAVSYQTAGLEYRIEYNRYREAPVTGLEYGVVYDRYEDGTVRVENSGSLVSGRTISLTLLEGGVQRSSQRTTTVDVRAVSGPANTVQVTNTSGSDLTLTVPTSVPEEVWVTEILPSQLDDSGDGGPALEGDEATCADITGPTSDGDGRYVSGCSYDESASEITLTFQRTEGGTPVRYDLRTAKVGFAAGADTGATVDDPYIVRSSTETPTTSTGQTVELRVQVRDQYNNPVSGVQVHAEVDESTMPSSESVSSPVTTDENGIATVTYRAPSSTTDDERKVVVSTASDPTAASADSKTAFRVQISDADSDGNILTGPAQIQFVEGSFGAEGPSGSTSGMTFSINNSGGATSSVDLTAVKVCEGSGTVTKLFEQRDGSGGAAAEWQSEVHVRTQTFGVEGVGTTRTAEAGDDPTTDGYDPCTKISLSSPLQLAAGDVAAYHLSDFRTLSGTTDMEGRTVRVTIYWEADGQTVSKTTTRTL